MILSERAGWCPSEKEWCLLNTTDSKPAEGTDKTVITIIQKSPFWWHVTNSVPIISFPKEEKKKTTMSGVPGVLTAL